jgi:hypothetical protein
MNIYILCPGRLEFIKCFIGKNPCKHKVFLCTNFKGYVKKELP